MKICTVPDCGKNAPAGGLCRRHYRQRPDQQDRAHQRYLERSKKWHEEQRVIARAKYSTAEGKKAAAVKRRTLKGLFSQAKGMAKFRGIVWTLTLTEFTSLRSNACSYCAFPLPEAGSGLDRIDNSLGYSAGNVSPCCTACNSTRGDTWTSEEMRTQIGPTLRLVKLARLGTGA